MKLFFFSTILLFTALASSSTPKADTTNTPSTNKVSQNENLADWLENKVGIPKDMVEKALSQDAEDNSALSKRNDQENTEIENENASKVDKQNSPQKKEDQEVAEESADENALESNEADDINSQSDTKANAIQKRGLVADDDLGLDGHFGHRHGCLNCRRRTTMIHRFHCVRRFVPRVFVAHIFRTGCGGCGGFRRRVSVGKMILIDRGCSVDVFVKFTRRPRFTRFPFLIRPRCGCRREFTTPIFLRHGIDGGVVGHRRLGCGCLFGGEFGGFGHRGLEIGYGGEFGGYEVGGLHRICVQNF